VGKDNLPGTLSQVPNVFVLTTGLSGSSVLTGLIAQAGFWPGESTEFKSNATGHYETYENSRFVALNDRLVELSGIEFDSKSWYQAELRQQFSDLHKTIDLTDYKAFIEESARHQPWVLKDPKLWVTLDFWLALFKDQNLHCVIATRSTSSLWLSQTNKRIIYDYAYLKNAEIRSYEILLERLHKAKISFTPIRYEDLLESPEQNLSRLNNDIGISLTLKNWRKVYRPPKKSRSIILTWLKAVMIYLKNYRERIR